MGHESWEVSRGYCVGHWERGGGYSLATVQATRPVLMEGIKQGIAIKSPGVRDNGNIALYSYIRQRVSGDGTAVSRAEVVEYAFICLP